MSDNSTKCKWYTGKKFDNCHKNIINDSIYCKSHEYAGDYTDEQKSKKKYCTSCKKVKCFLDDSKTCGCANERVTKLNNKRKEDNKINIEKKNEQKEKQELEKQKLVEEQDYKVCKSCDQARPSSSFIGSRKEETTNCQICRDRQKEKDAKRTTTRNWAEEYKKNPELYKKKLEYNRNNGKNTKI